MTIVVLDEQTINQIAAGEVIENCGSVVKELVENSLDAGAQSITVETSHNGIRISDDGCGMSPDELLLCLERHATSKITRVEDLNSLHTLGFRGEALPSIASVAKVSLHSAPGNTGEGAQLGVVGGEISALKSAPRRRGTTIDVKSLFFNVPARKKFQKSRQADLVEIHKILTKIALCHPKVSFVWKNDEKLQFALEGGEGELARIKSLFGEEFAQALTPVDYVDGVLSIQGFTSKSAFHRPNRTGQHLFINGRSVVSPFVAGKVLEGYGTRLPTHRYPLCILHLKLPPSWVDVNVHPQKKEVRLREQAKVAPFLVESVERALQPVEYPKMVPLKIEYPDFHHVEMVSESAQLYQIEDELEVLLDEPPAISSPSSKPLIQVQLRVLSKVGRYLLVENEEGIRIVDSVAARAALISEQLTVANEKKAIQTLLLPLQFEFSGAEKLALETQLDALGEIGISIRPFGGDTFIVDAIPCCLEEDEIEEIIRLFLQEGNLKFPVASVLKRGVRTLEEGHALVQQLLQRRIQETPDGKPTYLLITEKELEKRFRGKN